MKKLLYKYFWVMADETNERLNENRGEKKGRNFIACATINKLEDQQEHRTIYSFIKGEGHKKI